MKQMSQSFLHPSWLHSCRWKDGAQVTPRSGHHCHPDSSSPTAAMDCTCTAAALIICPLPYAAPQIQVPSISSFARLLWLLSHWMVNNPPVTPRVFEETSQPCPLLLLRRGKLGSPYAVVQPSGLEAVLYSQALLMCRILPFPPPSC